MKVSKIKTDEEMELIKNKEVTTKMINKIINDDAEIYTETGELLFKFKKNVLTGGKDFYKNVKPFMDKHPSSNRGSVSGGIKKNIKDNKVILIILVIILICLIYYQSNYMNKDIEGFVSTPNPSSTISPKLLNNLFFINNFPKQNLKKIWETKMDNGKFISFWMRHDEINYY